MSCSESVKFSSFTAIFIKKFNGNFLMAMKSFEISFSNDDFAEEIQFLDYLRIAFHLYASWCQTVVDLIGGKPRIYHMKTLSKIQVNVAIRYSIEEMLIIKTSLEKTTKDQIDSLKKIFDKDHTKVEPTMLERQHSSVENPVSRFYEKSSKCVVDSVSVTYEEPMSRIYRCKLSWTDTNGKNHMYISSSCYGSKSHAKRDACEQALANIQEWKSETIKPENPPQIITTNPVGRLHEVCPQLGLAPPEFSISADCGAFYCICTIKIANRKDVYRSFAPTKKPGHTCKQDAKHEAAGLALEWLKLLGYLNESYALIVKDPTGDRLHQYMAHLKKIEKLYQSWKTGLFRRYIPRLSFDIILITAAQKQITKNENRSKEIIAVD